MHVQNANVKMLSRGSDICWKFLVAAKSIANAVQTHLCALRYDARSAHSTTTRLNIVLSGFIGPSLEQKLFLYQGNVTYSLWLWLILIQNVLQFSRICILRSDEKIPSRIRVPTNLVIWTRMSSIDESRHFVICLIWQFHLSSGFHRMNRLCIT